MENFLKKIREDKGLSVIELSKLSGIARDTIYKIENCKSIITKKNMEKLEKALNVSSSQLYGGSDTLISLKYFTKNSLDDIINNTNYELVGISHKLLELFNAKNHKQIIILKFCEKNMEPIISNGDFLLIDLECKDIENNKIYLIKENNKLKIKRIRQSSPFNTTITILSENQIDGEYPPYDIDINIAKNNILGQVVFYGRSIL